MPCNSKAGGKIVALSNSEWLHAMAEHSKSAHHCNVTRKERGWEARKKKGFVEKILERTKIITRKENSGLKYHVLTI